MVASSHIWAAGAAAPVCGTEMQLDHQPFPERGGVTACKGKAGGASLHLWVRPVLSSLSGPVSWRGFLGLPCPCPLWEVSDSCSYKARDSWVAGDSWKGLASPRFPGCPAAQATASSTAVCLIVWGGLQS